MHEEFIFDKAELNISPPQISVPDKQRLRLLMPRMQPFSDSVLHALKLGDLAGANLLLFGVANGESHVYGSAALIAPGFAFAAGHVIDEHISCGHFAACDTAFYAFGFSEGKSHPWIVSEISYNEQSDIAILVLQYASDIPDELSIAYFGCCTRLPRIGERVTAIGFRATNENREANLSSGMIDPLEGFFLASSGPVTDIWPTGRPLLNRPSFAAELSTIGGMSGGPVLNEDGRLIGIVTRSTEPFEGDPPSTSVTLIWDGLMTSVRGAWPPFWWPDQPEPLMNLIKPEDGWRLSWDTASAKFSYQKEDHST